MLYSSSLQGARSPFACRAVDLKLDEGTNFREVDREYRHRASRTNHCSLLDGFRCLEHGIGAIAFEFGVYHAQVATLERAEPKHLGFDEVFWTEDEQGTFPISATF